MFRMVAPEAKRNIADSMSVGFRWRLPGPQLRVHGMHRAHQVDESVQHVIAGSGHPAARSECGVASTTASTCSSARSSVNDEDRARP
jgi:hypothetical protein